MSNACYLTKNNPFKQEKSRPCGRLFLIHFVYLKAKKLQHFKCELLPAHYPLVWYGSFSAVRMLKAFPLPVSRVRISCLNPHMQDSNDRQVCQ